MAMRRNQPKVQAKDLPDTGVMNSASFRQGEKRAISSAGTCGSMGTAMASAKNPAIKPSTANRTKRSSLRWGIAVDSNRGFRGADAPSCGKISRRLKNPRGTMNSRRTVTFVSVILVATFAALIVWPRAAMTQQDQAPQKQRTPTIDEYQPKSTLVTKEHKIERAKFPFIDIHSHHWNPTPEEVDRLGKRMDTINLSASGNFDGATG